MCQPQLLSTQHVSQHVYIIKAIIVMSDYYWQQFTYEQVQRGSVPCLELNPANFYFHQKQDSLCNKTWLPLYKQLSWLRITLPKTALLRHLATNKGSLESLKYKNFNHFPNFALYLVFFIEFYFCLHSSSPNT